MSEKFKDLIDLVEKEEGAVSRVVGYIEPLNLKPGINPLLDRYFKDEFEITSISLEKVYKENPELEDYITPKGLSRYIPKKTNVSATAENIRKYSGKKVVEVLKHDCIKRFAFPKATCALNLDTPVYWEVYIHTYEPRIKEEEIDKDFLSPIKTKVISEIVENIGRDQRVAKFIDIGGSISSPLSVFEICYSIPLYEEIENVSSLLSHKQLIKRNLIFEIYATEDFKRNMEKEIKKGDYEKMRRFLTETFKEIFPDVFEKAKKVYEKEECPSIETLPIYVYEPNRKQFRRVST